MTRLRRWLFWLGLLNHQQRPTITERILESLHELHQKDRQIMALTTALKDSIDRLLAHVAAVGAAKDAEIATLKIELAAATQEVVTLQSAVDAADAGLQPPFEPSGN